MADHDEDLDLLKSIRVLAYSAVKKRDPAYLFRFIMRWYSQAYHTPLTEVEKLPVEDVLMHFFEARYEAMDDEDRHEEIDKLLETKVERTNRERREAEDKEATDAFLQAASEEAQKSAAANPVPLDKRAIPDERAIAVPVMGQVLPTTFADLAKTADPKLKDIPPDINMKFVDESELNDAGDWDLLGPPKKG